MDRLGDPGQIDAVLVISDLASPRSRGPLLVPWSSDTRRSGIGLQRTVADSIRQELDRRVGTNGTLGRLVRLSFLIGLGAQGVLLDHGYDAVRVSGSGELPPGGATGSGEIDRDRLGGLGRHAPGGHRGRPGRCAGAGSGQLRARGQPGDARLDHRPAGAVAPDPRSRGRGRRLRPGAPPPGRSASGSAGWCLPAPLVASMLLAALLALTGGTPEPPPAPPAPDDYPSTAPPWASCSASPRWSCC